MAVHVRNLDVFSINFSAKRNTYSIPRLIDDALPGFLCSFSVPAQHVHRPSWEWTQHTQYFLTLATWTHLTSTLLRYSDGCCSADTTVGTSDHEGPPHHRHIQVLWLKIFSCCFIALPKDQKKGKEKPFVLILLFCKRPNEQDDSQFATFSAPLVESGDAAIINMACQWMELLWLQPSWGAMRRSLTWYPDTCPWIHRKKFNLKGCSFVLTECLHSGSNIHCYHLFFNCLLLNLHRHMIKVRTQWWTDLV